MDVALLAKDVVGFLVPFLPYLIKGAESAAGEIGKEFGRDAVERARMLWKKIQAESNQTAGLALAEAARTPNDSDAQAVMRLNIKRLLEEDPSLADEVRKLMKNEVVQRVIAQRNSTIRGVKQSADKESNIQQDVIATDSSSIEDVSQSE